MRMNIAVLLVSLLMAGCGGSRPTAAPMLPPPLEHEDDIVVCHEAGHALCAYASGYVITHVVLARQTLIDTGHGTLTRGKLVFASGPAGTPAEQAWYNCSAYTAGFAGEILCGRGVRVYGGDDLRLATDNAGWLIDQGLPAPPWPHATLTDNSHMDDILRECQRHAAETLAKNLPQFSALRAAFLYDVDGLITGEEITRLISSP